MLIVLLPQPSIHLGEIKKGNKKPTTPYAPHTSTHLPYTLNTMVFGSNIRSSAVIVPYESNPPSTAPESRTEEVVQTNDETSTNSQEEGSSTFFDEEVHLPTAETRTLSLTSESHAPEDRSLFVSHSLDVGQNRRPSTILWIGRFNYVFRLKQDETLEVSLGSCSTTLYKSKSSTFGVSVVTDCDFGRLGKLG